jgi:hypothetical protein
MRMMMKKAASTDLVFSAHSSKAKNFKQQKSL